MIAKNRLMLVYRYPPIESNGRFVPVRGRVEACLIRRGTRMTLLDPERERGRLPRTTFNVVAFAGPIVAYSIGHYGVDSGASAVFVTDIASKRILQELPGDSSSDAGILSHRYITDFALSSSGSAAWIEDVGGAHRVTNFVVHAAPIGDERAVLEEGPDIAAHSLNLLAGTLSWERAGTRRAARLMP